MWNTLYLLARQSDCFRLVSTQTRRETFLLGFGWGFYVDAILLYVSSLLFWPFWISSTNLSCSDLLRWSFLAYLLRLDGTSLYSPHCMVIHCERARRRRLLRECQACLQVLRLVPSVHGAAYWTHDISSSICASWVGDYLLDEYPPTREFDSGTLYVASFYDHILVTLPYWLGHEY